MSFPADSPKPQPLAAPGRAAVSDQMPPLTELEDALDTGGEGGKRTILEAQVRIDDLADRTSQALASGADRAEYARLNAIAKACQTAKEILVRYELLGKHNARMHSSRFF